MTYPFLLEFKLGGLIPTGYVIYFFLASSNTTFDYNSPNQFGQRNVLTLAIWFHCWK